MLTLFEILRKKNIIFKVFHVYEDFKILIIEHKSECQW